MNNIDKYGFSKLLYSEYWQKNLEKFPQGVEAGLVFKDHDTRKSLALEIEQKRSFNNSFTHSFSGNMN